MAIGVGLLSTFKVSTGHAMWIGYQALCTSFRVLSFCIIFHFLPSLWTESIFQERFLLVQPARLPGDGGTGDIDYYCLGYSPCILETFSQRTPRGWLFFTAQLQQCRY